MIIFRCQNGLALFRITRDRPSDSLQWHCLTDGSLGEGARTPAGYEQLLKDMATKAVALRGSILQVLDLSELI